MASRYELFKRRIIIAFLIYIYTRMVLSETVYFHLINTYYVSFCYKIYLYNQLSNVIPSMYCTHCSLKTIIFSVLVLRPFFYAPFQSALSVHPKKTICNQKLNRRKRIQLRCLPQIPAPWQLQKRHHRNRPARPHLFYYFFDRTSGHQPVRTNCVYPLSRD